MRVLPKSRRVTPTVLSLALILFSALWFVSARIFYVANRHSKDGIFQAPIWTLLFLVLVPLSSFLLGTALFRARQSEDQPLSVIDYCALAAGLAPFVFLVFLFVNAAAHVRNF
jgi:uncharacterized membrane protein